MAEQYLNLLDMFDGGGAGKSGDRFEGGGLLSVLANLVATPAGTEQRRLAMKNSTGKAITTAVDEMMRQRAAMMDMQRQRVYSKMSMTLDLILVQVDLPTQCKVIQI